MKTSRFTDSQIIAVLKEAEAGTPVPELCRTHGISNATFLLGGPYRASARRCTGSCSRR
jgi:putative transposase